MKLQIEISEYEKDGELNFSVGTVIVPVSKESISTLDKPKQLAKFDRLTDLSAVIARAVARFYQKETTSNADLSSSKDSRVRII